MLDRPAATDGHAVGAAGHDDGSDSSSVECIDATEQFDLVFVRNHHIAQRQ